MKFIFVAAFLFILCEKSLPQWINLNSGTNEQLNKIHFLNQNTGFVVGNNGKILKTTNGGTNWENLISGTSENLYSIYFFNASTGIVTGNSGTILKTINGGVSWTSISSGLTDILYSISFSGSTGIIGGTSQSILRSTDSGDSWTVIKSGFFGGGYRGSFMVNSSTGFVAGVNAIFAPLVGKTTNGGSSWNYSTFYVNTNEATLQDISFKNETTGIAVSTIFSGTGGVSRTTNGGQNWSHMIFNNALFGVDFPSAQTGYAVGANGIALKTQDAGLSWMILTTSSNSNLRDVSFADTITGFAVGENGTILKTISGGVVSINVSSGNQPESFELFQNYPNPFNPVTKIKFSLPKSEHASLRVYDLKGKQITTIVNEVLGAGDHNFEFDAGRFNLSSGAYFYRLETASFTETKKMIILK